MSTIAREHLSEGFEVISGEQAATAGIMRAKLVECSRRRSRSRPFCIIKCCMSDVMVDFVNLIRAAPVGSSFYC